MVLLWVGRDNKRPAGGGVVGLGLTGTRDKTPGCFD